MTIVAKTGQYPESLYDFGHAPGVSGGAIGAGSKLAIKYGYRGAKWVARRLLKPNRYTYRGAVTRGIITGTIIASQIDEFEEEVTDGIPPRQPQARKYPNRFQQGNRRRSIPNRSRRRYDRHSNCCCN